ncbi:hypothetical protein [Streptomyces sp. NRRL B-24572]|uniref:hypothetical protein n=1 Tax=Streptomyces sp. NRRL B-24572 TaxID=1962156 RepID=UPI000A3AA0E7|nr:hypothetical protein [Streptomyces sp. NRRL B-24572]
MKGRDWREMTRADFDAAAPLLFGAAGGGGRVPAVADSYGTEALFGDKAGAPPAPGKRAGVAEPPQEEVLFTLDL